MRSPLNLAGLKLKGAVAFGLDLDADLQRGSFDARMSGTGEKLATGLAALDGLAGARLALAADLSADGRDPHSLAFFVGESHHRARETVEQHANRRAAQLQ